MIYFDTETCGLHSPIVLIQWSEDDGPVHLHSVWTTPISDTIELIEKFATHEGGVCGFNLVFDWFHLCQIYTTLILMPDWSEHPIDHINLYASLEPKARLGPCLKPVTAHDVMLHARKGPYQSTMQRDDVRIKRVPTPLAYHLIRELEKRIPLRDIYFARKKNPNGPKWSVYDVETEDGKIHPDFKDVVLRFAPSSALKTLAVDALGYEPDEILLFADVEVEKGLYPNELGYAPFALAIGNEHDWQHAWPDVITQHVSHWQYNSLARKYAANDVVLTRDLYKYFGSPPAGDTDSLLACMVAAVRWRGFAIDHQGISDLCKDAKNKNKRIVPAEMVKDIPFLKEVPDQPGFKYISIPTSPAAARKYINSVMSNVEQLVAGDATGADDIRETTKKPVLEAIAEWRVEDAEGKLTPHPAAIRAKEVLEARQGDYEVDFYNKLLLAKRFHASSGVIGALSGRMSGGSSAKGIEGGGRAKGDGLNPQGVKREKKIRSKFPLADNGLILCAGDFEGFEVTLAEAIFNDPDLRKDLLSGKKIHALFGQFLFPGMSYDEIVASAGTSNDIYEKCKRCFFATIYGAEANKIKDILKIPIEQAQEALIMFGKRYPRVGEYTKMILEKHCALRQPGGIGTKVEWIDPADYVESMLGFRRYFTLENQICKALFELANKPPKQWAGIKIRVQRRDRMQTASGATQSALYAAAFTLQSFNVRAAKNHEIQSLGAQITKEVQSNIWKIQPSGISKWLVVPLNVHDEIQCPSHPSVIKEVEEVVRDTVEAMRPKVPLIKMDWKSNLKTWADK